MLSRRQPASHGAALRGGDTASGGLSTHGATALGGPTGRGDTVSGDLSARGDRVSGGPAGDGAVARAETASGGPVARGATVSGGLSAHGDTVSGGPAGDSAVTRGETASGGPVGSGDTTSGRPAGSRIGRQRGSRQQESRRQESRRQESRRQGPWRRGLWLRRGGVVAVAALLAGVTLTAAPAMATPSAIGDGSVVDDDDYIGSGNPDPGVEATTGPVQADACTVLAGAVSPRDAADAQSRLVGQTPLGAGEWQYTLCAQTRRASQQLAARYPGVAQAKAYCATGATEATGAACAVVVVWAPEDRTPPRPEKNPPKRLGAFDHWLDFTPELTTSPTYQDALVAQLPTWVWDRNTADIRGICLPLFGGVCGFATRLGTTWKTEGDTFCRSPGRPYRPGIDDPRSASSCSWTYGTLGTYEIEGCKNWLVIVWRLPWFIPIVFPLELCHTDQVSVQEAQILSGTPR